MYKLKTKFFKFFKEIKKLNLKLIDDDYSEINLLISPKKDNFKILSIKTFQKKRKNIRSKMYHQHSDIYKSNLLINLFIY